MSICVILTALYYMITFKLGILNNFFKFYAPTITKYNKRIILYIIPMIYLRSFFFIK